MRVLAASGILLWCVGVTCLIWAVNIRADGIATAERYHHEAVEMAQRSQAVVDALSDCRNAADAVEADRLNRAQK